MLCVEDNRDDYDLVKLLLQELARESGEACFVEHAGNASLARNLSDGGTFDLFIVDQLLNGLEVGTDFIGHLLERAPAAPVILVTHCEELDEEAPAIRNLAAENLVFLRKGDLNLDSLRDCLHRLGVSVFGQTEG